MKIRLELESDDVREMVLGYFSARGFSVKNLDEICASFDAAYPKGIVVEAQPVAASSAPTQVPQDVAVAPVAVAAPPADENVVTLSASHKKQNPRLGFSDLMDPTVHGNVPTRDELLEETQRELQQILKMSKSLERT